MLSITLKIAVDAPIPSASVSIAIAANPGVFPRFLSAYRISCPSVSIFTPTSISTQFDQPPLQSTLLQSTPLQSTLLQSTLLQSPLQSTLLQSTLLQSPPASIHPQFDRPASTTPHFSALRPPLRRGGL